MEVNINSATLARFALDNVTEGLEYGKKYGRHGWDDPDQCTTGALAKMLGAAVERRDVVSIVTYAAMLAARYYDSDDQEQEEVMHVQV